MNASNFPHSFTVEISAYFSGIKWSTNVVENSIAFGGIAHSTLTFTQNSNIPLVLDKPVVVRDVKYFLTQSMM